jgi:negative regulator of flagellin synthesis FlgM
MKVTKFFPQIKTESKIQVKKSEEAASAGPVPSRATDRVELSAGSKDVQRMQELLRQTPEVRAEKVGELKARIERGEYHPEPREVADRMLAGHLAEDLTDI